MYKSPSASKKPGTCQSVISFGNSRKVFEVFDSSSSDEDVEEEEAANIEIYEGSSSDDDLDVVFVEHRSIANASNNSINREPIVAKLRRDVSMQADKAAGKMVGRQREELAVPVRKTDKMLEVEQWQAWITLQQQVRDYISAVSRVFI